MTIKQAVILCGGLGTRLGRITKRIPKPLVVVNNLTVLEHIIKNLSRYGITEVLLLCHYKSDLFKKKFHNKFYFNIKIKCIIEKSLLGSSGALLNAKKYLKNNFFFCNGDTLFDINLCDFFLNFGSRRQIALLALKKVKNNKRYDTFLINKGNKLKIDVSKKSKFIHSGMCIFSKKIIKLLDKRGSLEKKIFTKLIYKKQLFGKVYSNDFIDMGTLKDLKKLPQFLRKIGYKPALFLDRDGVINKDSGYVFKKNEIIWRNNIFKYVKKFNDKNFYVFVITNQSGIGRGYYSENDVKKLHIYMNEKFIENGAHIDEFFYAPYFKDSKKKIYTKNKNLRKPNIGMIKLAQKNWNINLSKSILIGDKYSDKQTAILAKIPYKILKFSQKLH